MKNLNGKHEVLTRFKNLFEEQKKTLLYSNQFVNENFHLQKDDLADEVDLTAVELETSMRVRLRNREALLLTKINEALLRIENGTFGECVSCGEEIELRRIEARPTATLCFSCKEEEEHKEGLHVDGRKPKSLGLRIRLA